MYLRRIRPRSVLVVLVLVILGASLTPSSAEEPAAANAPVFEALEIDGRVSSVRLEAISAAGARVTPIDGPSREVPLTGLVKLSREDRRGRGVEGADVVLPDGDRLANVIIGTATDAAVEVHSYALGKMSVPLDAVLGLIMTPPADAEALDRLWRRIQAEPRSSEVVWLVNGDRVAGTLLGMDDRAVRLQVEGKPMEIDRAGIAAIGFDPALTAYDRPKTAYLEAALVGGTRLGIVDFKLEKGRVSAVSRFGASVQFPLDDVVGLAARTTDVDYLTERTVDGRSYVPYLGPVRPYRIDAAVDGRPFQLAGRRYDRGIGTQSRTLLAYKLKPDDRRFQALVGLDERAGPLGSVVFRVVVDDQPRFTSPIMTFRDPPRPIDVDLSGGKLLILITEFGERGDVRDLADWIDPRIIR